MSIDPPPFLYPVLKFYGLDRRWPSFDEDKVGAFSDLLMSHLAVTESCFDTIVEAVVELGESTTTESFTAWGTWATDFKRDKVKPYLDEVKVGVPLATHGIQLAITSYKTGVLGILVANAAADIPLIMSGQFWLAGLKKLATKQILVMLLDEIEERVLTELVGIGTKYIEVHWLNDLKTQAKLELKERLTKVSSVGVSSGASGTGGQIVSSAQDVSVCVVKLSRAGTTFTSAVEKWRGEDEEAVRFFDGRFPWGSPDVAEAVEKLLTWGQDQLKAFLIDLVLLTVQNMGDVMATNQDTIDEAEQQCFAWARGLQFSLSESKAAGPAQSDTPPPDFSQTLTSLIGTGTAGADEDAPDPLKAPVDGTKGAGDGRSRNDRNDLGVLDPPVDEPKGAGRADATDDAGSAPALDPTVEPV